MFHAGLATEYRSTVTKEHRMHSDTAHIERRQKPSFSARIRLRALRAPLSAPFGQRDRVGIAVLNLTSHNAGEPP